MANLLPQAFNYLTEMGRRAPQPGLLDPVQQRRNALAMQEQELRLAEHPEERKWLEEERGMKRSLFEQGAEDRLRKTAEQGFKNTKDVLQFFHDIAPGVTLANWDSWRKLGIDLGENMGMDRGMLENQLPDSSQFKNEQEFEDFKQKGLASFGRPEKAETELFIDEKGRQVYLKKGGPIPPGWRRYEKEAKPDKLSIIQNALKEKLGREPTSVEIQDAMQKYDVSTTGQKAEITIKGQQEAAKSMFSEDAINQAVEYFMSSGELPYEFGRMSYRYPSVIAKIYEKAREKGFTGDQQAFKKAAYKGLTTEYTTTARQKAVTLRYEAMLKQNTDALEQMNTQVFRTKFPKVNDITLWMRENAGDPDVVAFKYQIGRVAVEWAKITSGSLGMAEVSVQAQNKMDQLLNAHLTPKQLEAGIQVIRMDATHTVNSFYMREAEQKKDVYGLIGKTPPPEPPTYKKRKVKIGGMEIETLIDEKMAGPMKAEEVAPSPSGEIIKFTEGDKSWNIPKDKIEKFKELHPNAKQEGQKVSQNVPAGGKGDYSNLDDETLLEMVSVYQTNIKLQREAEKRWGPSWREKIGGKSLVG
jgi:hypothetical protein